MQITAVKLIEMGVNIEIMITVYGGLRFYTHYGFETEEEARTLLETFGLEETKEE